MSFILVIKKLSPVGMVVKAGFLIPTVVGLNGGDG